MIQLKNFGEMKQAFDEGKIPWNIVQDQAHMLIGIAEDNIIEHTTESKDVTPDNVEWLLKQHEGSVDYSFIDYLGGDVFICETPEDLAQVEGCDMDFPDTHDGRWPNLTDMPLSGDVCYYVQGKPKFIIFVLFWNNAGGPAYFIPEHLWTENVINSVKLTNDFWGYNAEKNV